MSKKKRRLQASRRYAFTRTWANGQPRTACPACGEVSPYGHFVPPGLGDEGFFYCSETLVNGLRMKLTDHELAMDRMMSEVMLTGKTTFPLPDGRVISIDYNPPGTPE